MNGASSPLELRLALRLFPRDFRARQGADLLETYEDWIAFSAPSERPRVRRQALVQLLRAGLAERFASVMPPSPMPPSRSPRSSALEDLWHDVKSAFRSLQRRPFFAAMVMLTLAIGLGTSAAMFGVVHGVLLEPLPYEDSHRLITMERIFTNDPDRHAASMSLPDVRDVRREIPGLEAVAGVYGTRETLLLGDEPQLIRTGGVSNGLLDVFGLAPVAGRDIEAADAVLEAPPVVVVGHEFWQRRLGGDPDVLGTAIELSSVKYEIVGVAPAGFDFPRGAEAWTALQIDTESDCGRGCHFLTTVGRLADETPIEALNHQLMALSEALEEQHPRSNTHKRFAALSMLEQQVQPVRGALWMLLGAVQLVVLIAAANVANLMLVRGSRRRREMTIRRAVGAGRLRLFRQLMFENSLLAAGGAALGWLVGMGVLRGFMALAPADLPRLEKVALDGPVLLFTSLLTLGVLMLFGLLPAWRGASIDLRSRAQAGERRGGRSRTALLTAEVALALMLLLGSGLLLRSFAAMTQVDLGYSAERMTRVSVLLPEGAYAEPEQAVTFAAQLEERLRTAPGVEAVGLAYAGPFGSAHITSHIFPLDRPESKPGEHLSASFDVVSPGYFDALSVNPVRGRFFTDQDTRQAPLALVISQELAERYFPGKDPVGEQTKIGVSFGFDDDDAVYTIVGVAPDIRAYSLTDKPAPAVYMAQAQTGATFLSAIVRSIGEVDIAPVVREQIHALDPALPLHSVRSQEAAVDEALGPHRFYLALLGGFAVVALVLSAIGLYAVIAYLVSQRTRELAVRMALGANSWSVLRLVLFDALRPAALGTVLGLVGAVLGARVLDGLLYGISSHDVLTYVTAPALLLVVAMLATLAPALRASRLAPRVALEEE